jgi:hypothetical protein
VLVDCPQQGASPPAKGEAKGGSGAIITLPTLEPAAAL